jgi:hypothetical protein
MQKHKDNYQYIHLSLWWYFLPTRYIRKHPYNEEGHHIQSFLCMESWEDYLTRMSRPCEWGDHILLQAVTDAFNLEVVVFNVFQDDIRRTEVNPGKTTRVRRIPIFLGHIGEFHYLSLRPDNWKSLWPYSKEKRSNIMVYRIFSVYIAVLVMSKEGLMHWRLCLSNVVEHHITMSSFWHFRQYITQYCTTHDKTVHILPNCKMINIIRYF